VAEVASTQDGYHELQRYYSQHPRLFKELMRTVGYSFNGSDEELKELAGRMPLVCFKVV